MNYNLILQYCKELNVKSVLDIGCNIGEFSYHLRNTGQFDKFVCVDLNEAFREDLERKGLEFHSVLLTSDHTERDVYYNPSDLKCTGTSVYREKTEHYANAVIKKQHSMTLNSFCKQNFDLIKIDTQGADYDIIMGGKNIISNAKVVVVETQVKEYNQGVRLQSEVIQLMEELGFESVAVVGTGLVEGVLFSEDLLFTKIKSRK